MSQKTFELLSQNVKISKDQALAIIHELSGKEVTIVNERVSAYLCGYEIKKTKKSAADIEKEMAERARKHAKSVKFAKKKKLPVPEMDMTPPEAFSIELTAHPHGRDLKENFIPQLKGMTIFPEMIKELQVYQPFFVELRGKKPSQQEKDERSLMTLFDKVYKHQGHVVRAWSEIKVNYQLGSNSVIFAENIKNYANFIAYLTEYRKIVNRDLKSDPRLMAQMTKVFEKFNPKANWFQFALEESLTMVGGGDPEHSKIPADLSDTKKMFWDTFKASSKEAKEFYSL